MIIKKLINLPLSKAVILFFIIVILILLVFAKIL